MIYLWESTRHSPQQMLGTMWKSFQIPCPYPWMHPKVVLFLEPLARDVLWCGGGGCDWLSSSSITSWCPIQLCDVLWHFLCSLESFLNWYSTYKWVWNDWVWNDWVWNDWVWNDGGILSTHFHLPLFSLNGRWVNRLVLIYDFLQSFLRMGLITAALNIHLALMPPGTAEMLHDYCVDGWRWGCWFRGRWPGVVNVLEHLQLFITKSRLYLDFMIIFGFHDISLYLYLPVSKMFARMKGCAPIRCAYTENLPNYSNLLTSFFFLLVPIYFLSSQRTSSLTQLTF
jgi:hypothetical protein